MAKTSKPLLRLDIHPSHELQAAIDRWRAEQPGVPPRAVAARMLLEETLMAKGVLRAAGIAKEGERNV